MSTNLRGAPLHLHHVAEVVSGEAQIVSVGVHVDILAEKDIDEVAFGLLGGCHWSDSFNFNVRAGDEPPNKGFVGVVRPPTSRVKLIEQFR